MQHLSSTLMCHITPVLTFRKLYFFCKPSFQVSKRAWWGNLLYLLVRISNIIYWQEWELQASSEDGRIKLTFESFAIEAHESGACIFDYLEVSYNSYSWKYCGQDTPGPIISSGGSMKVTFHSDLLEADTGFIARWEELEGELICL